MKEHFAVIAHPAQFLATEAAPAAARTEGNGWTWPVEIIQEGFAGGTLCDEGGCRALPHYFTRQVVAEFAQAANHARFGRRHPGPQESEDDPERIAGWFENGRLVGGAARATLHLLKSEEALRQKLLAARQAKKLDLFGLSVLSYVAFKPGKIQGREALVSEKLGKLISVDLVTEPGAGGKFLEVAASKGLLSDFKEFSCSCGGTGKNPTADPAQRDTGRKLNGGAMKEQIKKVLEALRKFDPGRAEGFEQEFGDLPEDKHAEFLVKVTEALAAARPGDRLPITEPAGQGEGTDAAAILVKAQEALAEARRLQTANLIERKLGEAKLPEPAARLVREHLEGSGDSRDVPAERLYEQVDAEIKRVREAFASFAQVGKVSSDHTVQVGLGNRDKVQLAMDSMLGVREAQKDPNTRPFRGIKEAYIYCTGDRDLTFQRGGFYRISEAIATADFPQILLNSLTKRLIQDYAALGMGGLELLFTPAPLGDYKTQDRVRMGYLGDLPTVSEGAAYTELTKPTDEKISYAPAKRGGLLTISEETIRNDDLGKIADFPERMARAGRRTLKQFITDFFLNNPAYDPDALAWFHATHSNLGSVALSAAELDAREILLMKQTEKDSAKRLGLPLEWIMVPLDLKATAYQINQNNEGTNSWFHRFGVGNERIIVNELMTDTNDWYYGSLPANAAFLEIGFLDGVQQPQIFLANNPALGTTFTNDQLQYKVKFVFGGDILDFRPVGKNAVV